MAEAEDVIVDAARHATMFVQRLLQRGRAAPSPEPTLVELAPRLDLVLTALHGRTWRLRVAQPPAPLTALAKLWGRSTRPWQRSALPAADASSIWLPRQLDGVAREDVPLLYRAMALQQAERSIGRDRECLARLVAPLPRDLFLVLESEHADAAMALALPGMRRALDALRARALRRRPPIESFARARQPLERWLRERLAAPIGTPSSTPAERVGQAAALAQRWPQSMGSEPLLKDWWTGDWPSDDDHRRDDVVGTGSVVAGDERPVRSARLARTPRVREADEDEDDRRPGASMVQTAQPHEIAGDPAGLQRPVDRESDDAAEGHAESVSELPQARLVRSSQRAHEVLLAEDAALRSGRAATGAPGAPAGACRYPEWDWRVEAYRDPGTTVWEADVEPGAAEWVERTMRSQRGIHEAVRRQFEMLRPQRVTLHGQDEGDEIDLGAWMDARADLRAGAASPQRLYRSSKRLRRDSAVVVLVDASGSTDSLIDARRRIIDVEREALLSLSLALDAAGDRHAVLSFSGEGPQRVIVRNVKRFGERHDDAVARRIAGLEPERYTRAGAALRHASRLLALQPARHRLLLLLSDGKPNDFDEYEGRYGVEDMRQAVIEARAAGLSPFCLTVDRQAAAYLPRIFGPHHYALLQRPERMPALLLDWMKRLLAH